MRIWIDLANSPHALLFAPLAQRLGQDGHQVIVTARDNAQTVELARERWPAVTVIGGDSPAERTAKLMTIFRRAAALRNWARAMNPDVALSHNSYSQIIASRTLGVPVVTAMDFEGQQANHIAFRLASKILLPEVVPGRVVKRQGAVPRKVVRYPGLKEELYIGDFDPNPAILAQLGVDPRPKVLVVARTPPSRALYHRFANPLFEQAMQVLGGRHDVVCIALTRHAEQTAAIEAMRLPNCIIPRAAIDSRSLIYAADAMIGAGGTMTREAALMGIPTWTVFAGEPPAVDSWLERQGKLKRLRDPTELAQLGPRLAEPRQPSELGERARLIERVIVDAVLAAHS